MKAANIFASMRSIYPPNLMSANKGIFSFDQIVEAHEFLKMRQSVGKAIVKV